MGRHDYTGLLYSQPSMLEGFARVLDIGGTFDVYNDSLSPAEADRLALLSDWYAVAADLHRATQAYASQVESTPPDETDDL